MAELNFKIGNSPNLPQNRENGTFYVAEDEKKMYLNDIVFGDTTNLETKERVSEIDETVSKAINELNNSCGFTQKIKYLPKNEITSGTTSLSEAIDVLADTKQETLVSGTNIKTINGESILGTGDLTIESNIQDAPSDGKTYGRNNGSWSSITIPEGETITDLGVVNITYHVISDQSESQEPIRIPIEDGFVDYNLPNGIYRFHTQYYYCGGYLLVSEYSQILLYNNSFFQNSITMDQISYHTNPIYAIRFRNPNGGLGEWRKCNYYLGDLFFEESIDNSVLCSKMFDNINQIGDYYFSLPLYYGYGKLRVEKIKYTAANDFGSEYKYVQYLEFFASNDIPNGVDHVYALRTSVNDINKELVWDTWRKNKTTLN